MTSHTRLVMLYSILVDLRSRWGIEKHRYFGDSGLPSRQRELAWDRADALIDEAEAHLKEAGFASVHEVEQALGVPPEGKMHWPAIGGWVRRPC